MLALETDRLIFRQWQESDYSDFAQYFADPERTRYLGGVKNAEEAWRLLATYIGHYQLRGYSYLAIEEKSTGNWLGSIGLWNSGPWPEPELGYWLRSNAEGKGYGSEAGLAAKHYALEVLQLESLVSYIDAENEPSKKLALRLGAKYDRTIDLLGFGPHEVYRYK